MIRSSRWRSDLTIQSKALGVKQSNCPEAKGLERPESELCDGSGRKIGWIMKLGGGA